MKSWANVKFLSCSAYIYYSAIQAKSLSRFSLAICAFACLFAISISRLVWACFFYSSSRSLLKWRVCWAKALSLACSCSLKSCFSRICCAVQSAYCNCCILSLFPQPKDGRKRVNDKVQEIGVTSGNQNTYLDLHHRRLQLLRDLLYHLFQLYLRVPVRSPFFLCVIIQNII